MIMSESNNQFTYTTTYIWTPIKFKNKKKRRMIKGYGGKKMDHNMNHLRFSGKDIEDACKQAAKAINKMLGADAIKEENIKTVTKHIKKEQGVKDVEEAVKEAAEAITGVASFLNEEPIQKIAKDIKKEQSIDKENIRKMEDESCLEEAAKIISGNRQNDYGTPEDSFQRIADYWNAYLYHRKEVMKGTIDEDYPLEGKDIAMMMVLFKIAREEHSHKHDNLVDICGYTAILDNMYKD